MKYFISIIFLAAAFMLGGCHFGYYKGEESKLVGTYRAELPDGGTETLELLPDGSCVQEIRLAGGETYLAYGTWKYSPLYSQAGYKSRGTYKYRKTYRCDISFENIRSTLEYDGTLNPDIAKEPLKRTIKLKSVYRSIFGNPKLSFGEADYYTKIK